MRGWRLYERINSRQALLRSAVAGDETITFTQVRQVVLGSVRVIADECAAWVASDPHQWMSGDANNPFDHMGPLRTPFESMWIEWTIPALPGGIGGDGTRFGAWVTEADPHPTAPTAAAKTLQLKLFWSKKQHEVFYEPAVMAVDVDEHGHALGIWMDRDPAKERNVNTRGYLLPALVAVGLMNCRNVRVDEVEPPIRPHRRKPRQPKQPKPLAHHVITLPSREGSRRGDRSLAQARTDAGPEMPLHVVRGHFKTFTPDAPLFGKHVGTYWWSDRVRGSLDQGRVSTIYRVGPTDPSSGP